MWWGKKKKDKRGDGPKENTRGHSGTCGALFVRWLFEMLRAGCLHDINNYGNMVD